MMKFVQRYLLKLIGLALFAWILSRHDLGAIKAVLRSVNLPLFTCSVALFLPLAWLKAVRWRAFVAGSKRLRMSRRKAYRYYLAAMFLGACTPGRLGELAKIGYAERYRVGLGRAAAATLLDRAWDFAMLLGLGYLAVLFFYGTRSPHALRLLLLLLAGAAGLAMLFFARRLVKRLLLRAGHALLSEAHALRLELDTNDFMAAIRGYPFRTWLTTGGCTLLAWLGYYLQRYVLSVSLGLDLNFLFCAIVMTAVALLTLLPVSILNIGTRDAALIVLLARVDVTSEQAVALSTLILASILINAAISGIFFFSLEGKPSHRDNI